MVDEAMLHVNAGDKALIYTFPKHIDIKKSIVVRSMVEDGARGTGNIPKYQFFHQFTARRFQNRSLAVEVKGSEYVVVS